MTQHRGRLDTSSMYTMGITRIGNLDFQYENDIFVTKSEVMNGLIVYLY